MILVVVTKYISIYTNRFFCIIIKNQNDRFDMFSRSKTNMYVNQQIINIFALGLKQAAEARKSKTGSKRKQKGKARIGAGLGVGGGGVIVGDSVVGGSPKKGVGNTSPGLNFNANRSRKTCSTAKQRLGKILGLKF